MFPQQCLSRLQGPQRLGLGLGLVLGLGLGLFDETSDKVSPQEIVTILVSDWLLSLARASLVSRVG